MRHEMRQGRGSGNVNNSGVNANINLLKNTTACHFCGKIGHWKRECKQNPDLVQNDSFP